MDISVDLSKRVWDTLTADSTSWHPLSGSVLLILMDEQISNVWSVQGVFDYYFFAKFFASAQLQHPDEAEREEFVQRVKKEIGIINSIAYYSMLSTYDRNLMYDIAEKLREVLFEMKSAPTG